MGGREGGLLKPPEHPLDLPLHSVLLLPYLNKCFLYLRKFVRGVQLLSGRVLYFGSKGH